MNLPGDHSAAVLLRRALLANAAFSTLCGTLIIAFDDRIVGVMTSGEFQLWPLGVMLIGFAVSLAWFATRKTLNSHWVRSVIVADLAWVIGTVVLLAGWHELLSLSGIWMLIAIGTVVLVFGELQWLGLRRLKKAMPGP